MVEQTSKAVETGINAQQSNSREYAYKDRLINKKSSLVNLLYFFTPHYPKFDYYAKEGWDQMLNCLPLIFLKILFHIS